MITRITGTVVERTTEAVTIDVNGIGYEVHTPAPDLDKCRLDEEITLFTHMHVRENSHELFGFTSAEAKQLFELLISVSGVGPKVAISILSLGEEKQIRRAIAGGNADYVAGASGVGKRLAERVAVDLKDKVGEAVGADLDAILSGDDAVDALVALGYPRSQAAQALSKVDAEKPSDERVKLALKEL